MSEPYKLSTGDRLREYQKRAAHKVFSGAYPRDKVTGGNIVGPTRIGTAVHVDMGLGKTIIALTAIADWFNFGILTKPVLVVAPIKVCETVWRQEARDWSHTKHLKFEMLRGNERDRAFALHRPCHVMLINPELLKWLQQHIRADWGSRFDALIIDESSMFKDNRSQRFRCLTNYGTRVKLRDTEGKIVVDEHGHQVTIPPHAFKRTAILTGTPSPNGYLNLWSPFYILDHGARLHKSFDTFKGRFFHATKKLTPHVSKFEINPEEAEKRAEYEARDGAPERIHELIADITIELNAEDYGVLPDVLPPFKHEVDMPNELRPKYDQLERESLLELAADPILAANGGAKSMMCWQMCNGAIYDTDAFGKKFWHELHDAKLKKLVELVETLQTNNIITYQFQHDLTRIRATFDKHGIPYAVLAGKNSEKIIERWNRGEIPNLLLHPQSAGHGINLQFGGYTIIWFTLLWSLERYLQTNARIARSGQKHPVAIHHILTSFTTDQLRYTALFEKGDDMSRFRKAVLDYQRLRGIDVITQGYFEGVTL